MRKHKRVFKWREKKKNAEFAMKALSPPVYHCLITSVFIEISARWNSANRLPSFFALIICIRYDLGFTAFLRKSAALLKTNIFRKIKK